MERRGMVYSKNEGRREEKEGTILRENGKLRMVVN